jgi:apolipoprotein N-acyltransferase
LKTHVALEMPKAFLRHLSKIALVMLTGVLLIAAFPDKNLSWLGWVALVPLLSDNKPPKKEMLYLSAEHFLFVSS